MDANIPTKIATIKPQANVKVRNRAKSPTDPIR